MSAELAVIIEGRCVPWQRGATYQGRRLTPKAQREYQRAVRWAGMCALAERGGPWPDRSRFAVELVVYEPDARRRDLDNQAKTVLDAMNGVVWADDSQIDALTVVRRLDRERPRVEVLVAALREGESASVDIVIENERPRGVAAPGALDRTEQEL